MLYVTLFAIDLGDVLVVPSNRSSAEQQRWGLDGFMRIWWSVTVLISPSAPCKPPLGLCAAMLAAQPMSSPAMPMPVGFAGACETSGHLHGCGTPDNTVH